MKDHTLKLGLVQMACTADIARNMQQAYAQAEALAKQGARLICLPELYRSLYFCQTLDATHFALAEAADGPSYQLFRQLAVQYKVSLIIPIFEEPTAGLYFNSAVIINETGAHLGTYRKQHIPHDPGFEEKYYFTPGDGGYRVWRTEAADFGTLICWDQWYPEAARLTALQGAQILFYPTAIGYSAGEPAEEGAAQLDAWVTVQRSHAIANNVFVVAVNRVGTEGGTRFWGNSFVANPLGKVLAHADETEQNLLVEIDLAEIRYYRQWWPFLRDRRIDTYAGITRRWGTGE
ncbi:MAG: carbon-nitrogen hydrolase [Bacteroidetes bacterium]|nr:carbon-nitrogen hydrolase [Bacteroidota bacterium]